MTTPASQPTTTVKAAAGGSFLLEERTPQEVFTPEDFNDEQRLIAETASNFAQKEVLPAAGAIEAKDYKVTRGLLAKAGELGLMATDTPEEYGGLAMDKVTSAIVGEKLSVLGSFAVTFSAHVGIGMLPIIWYGTPEQKQKYLPKLATGEWVGAYALSEASSGSDAMGLRTRAVLSPDGQHYVVNGEKMWTTNAGFADLFTVFAKVDGEKFTAFLIERNTPGFSVGKEEHKLGIRGSSTCPLILIDCKVPVANLLGELGKGHHIAFNILNIGRFKLGASAIGAAKNSLANAVRYAKERKAFGKAIGEFGLIQQKLAESATGIFVGESMAYRTIGMIDAALSSLEGNKAHDPQEIQKKVEEYVVECSILKVWGSEMLDMVVDHTMQIYGGYGYVEEYPAERAYRDSRINRIFEGTNEINRLIITGWLMKRAASGQLPLLNAIKTLMAEAMEPPSLDASDDTDDPLRTEAALLANLKKTALFCSGSATQKYLHALQDQQEIMGDLADMTMQVFALESALLRARKLASQPQAQESQSQTAHAMLKLFAADALAVVEKAARRVLAAVAEGDTLRTQLAILRRLLKHTPEDTIALSRAVAQRQLEACGYKL
ncbi:acyl-CoA dehydrogenase family protein [Terriglobus albidus]|uniref:acyl-CoA dehydrogenase family protein n=1 Tax=Terriglobus albidus TaxID=1592106 RepID=UPI0021E0D647|nr:acyl-CoA dehydrogenase family protein [Terriglobus albidus]